MDNLTKIEDANRHKTKLMILEHREDNSKLQNVLSSGKFTPVVMTSGFQKEMIENFKKLSVSINYTKAARVFNKPISSVHDSFVRLCKTNKIEFALIINGHVVGKVKSSIKSICKDNSS